MTVHKLDDGTFVISSGGCWLPGIYADQETANYAFQFSDAQLSALNNHICHFERENRAITMDDLRAARPARISKEEVASPGSH